MEKVCEAYKCKPIEGMLSHQLKQFKIDGEKTIIQNPNDAQKKEHEKFTLETHEVSHFFIISFQIIVFLEEKKNTMRM